MKAILLIMLSIFTVDSYADEYQCNRVGNTNEFACTAWLDSGPVVNWREYHE